jgi:uridine phosphorylase
MKNEANLGINSNSSVLPNSRSFPLTASDLPIDEEGRIYHLQIKPEQLAPNILLVGDPERAEVIGAEFLRDIIVEQEHRGLVTVTGTAETTGGQATIISPVKTTVSTSGMGTPSLEIVIQELVALNEIDFATRSPKTEFPRLQVIRIGTCGGLQKSTKLGTPIITSYAVGMDNTGLFYEAPVPDETCSRLEKEITLLVQNSMKKESRYCGKIQPYVSRAEPLMVKALAEASQTLGIPTRTGLTVSCSGFFAAQGRNISRVPPSVPDLDRILSEYDPRLDGQCIENMEMETSFLINFLGGLGYWGASICTAIANRREDTFFQNYQNAVRDSIKIALLAMANLRTHSSDNLKTN